MPTLTLPHAGGAAGNGTQNGWWTAVGTANLWDCVVSAEATQYVAGVSINTNNNPFDSNIDLGIGPYYNSTGLSPSTVITSITVHIVHRNNDAFTRDTGILYYSQVTGTPYTLQANALLPGSAAWRDDSVTVALNPETGLAWTYADLFTELGGVGYGYNRFTFYMIDNGHPYPSYQIDQIYLVVTTVSAPTTEVDITGSGNLIFAGRSISLNGAALAPSSSGIGIGGGASSPPELHGSQWGLEYFTLRSRLEERF